jgi:hypothetical protein
MSRLSICILTVIVSAGVPSACFGTLIGSGDVVAIPSGVNGSGNGTLDLRMFTFSGSEIDNESGAFNGDNGNNTLPHNNSAATFAESYVTTAGKVQDYYKLNFPNGSGGSTVNEIVLFLDLSENGGEEETNNGLTVVDFYLNPSTISGNPNPVGSDVSSNEQAAIDQGFTGGTLVANLAAMLTLPTVANGAGHADHAIFTHINPFDLSANDVLLLNVSMTGLSDGSEEIYMSGDFSGSDVMAAVPESSGFVLGTLVCGVIGLGAVGRGLKSRLIARG